MSDMDCFEKHRKVIEENRDLLIKAEKIKRSKEFKSAIHYFQIQLSRGNIRERPTLENNYEIKL